MFHTTRCLRYRPVVAAIVAIPLLFAMPISAHAQAAVTSATVAEEGATPITGDTLEFFAEVQQADSATEFDEVAGEDRVETAVRISQTAFPAGSTPGAVLVTTSGNWPDALGGSALAGAVDGPVLLAGQTLDSQVIAELNRLRDLGAQRAYILGGTNAVSRAVRVQLNNLFGAANVERIGGATRYETSFMIAEKVATIMNAAGTPLDGTVVVATGRNFPDALSISPLAAGKVWPIILAQVDAQGRPTLAMEFAMSDRAGAQRAIIVGGDAVVSATTESWLNQLFGGADNVSRLGGRNRYHTARLIATFGVNQHGFAWDRVAIATGENFPDALAGGVLQAKANSVMLLTNTATLNPQTAEALSTNRAAITRVTYLGGLAAISQNARNQIAAVLD